LIYSGLKLLLTKEQEEHLDTENHPIVKWVSRFFWVTKQPHNGAFFVNNNGKRFATSLFVVLMVVEFTDVVFAVDSVPAIFGITRDPYLVFASNIFAIMGLRSLFFLLGHSMKKLSTLKYGLSLILVFIGAKMLFNDKLQFLGFTEVHSLLVLAFILVLTYITSAAPGLFKTSRRKRY
jgi:tellurite resistance protein TerC